MKSMLMGSIIVAFALGLYLTPTETKSCHDVGFQLEDKLMNLTTSSKSLRRGFEKTCDLAQAVAHSHGLETLVDERLSSCFDALEIEPLVVEDVERPCAIGGFSVAARL